MKILNIHISDNGSLLYSTCYLVAPLSFYKNEQTKPPLRMSKKSDMEKSHRTILFYSIIATRPGSVGNRSVSDSVVDFRTCRTICDRLGDGDRDEFVRLSARDVG